MQRLQVPAYGHVVCGGCSIMLMYPQGAQSVKCSVCHYVSPVNATTIAEAGAAQRQGAKPSATVVIENPPTIDEKGNEVRTCMPSSRHVVGWGGGALHGTHNDEDCRQSSTRLAAIP